MESGGGVYQSTPASKVPSRWEHRERLSPRVQDVPKTTVFVCGSLRLASLCSNVNVNINAVKRRWTAAPAPWPKQEPGGCEGGKNKAKYDDDDDQCWSLHYPGSVRLSWTTRQWERKHPTLWRGKKKKKSYSSCGATIPRLHRCITAVTQTIRELCLCRKLTHLSCPRGPALWNCLYFRWRNNLSPV